MPTKADRIYVVSTFQTLEKIHEVKASSAKAAHEAVKRLIGNEEAPEVVESLAGHVGEEKVISLSLVRRIQ